MIEKQYLHLRMHVRMQNTKKKWALQYLFLKGP